MNKKLLILLLTLSAPAHCFLTIPDIQKLATKISEFPKSKNNNWIYPDYSALYKSLNPSFFKQIVKKSDSFITNFLNDLATITLDRSKKVPYSPIVKLSCATDSTIYIWADLHGGFHSLARSIEWLQKNGILNEQLKIVQPNHYLLFNGDAINYGPYGIATLYTIISLMHANPDEIFYIAGKEEKKDFWINGLLKAELSARATDYPQSEKLIHNFFSTLPLALYIANEQNQSSFIRISDSGRDDAAIKEDAIPSVVAIVKTDNWQKRLHAKNGLALIEQDQGATAWSTFSSPVQTHKELLQFDYDAFAVIIIKEPLQASTISLYNRKSNSTNDFARVIDYNVQSGAASGKQNGPEKNIFTIGSTMSLLVQGVPVMGRRTELGMSTRINKANQANELDTLIRAVVYNDDYTPRAARRNITNFLNKEHIDTILLPVGSPTLNSYLDYIKDNKVLVLFPITGGPQFRKAELKGIVHFRGTYEDEVRALVDHIIAEKVTQRFAFFYQDDAYGQGPLQAAHDELTKKGITEWTDVPYQRNSVNFKAQAQKIKDAQPDAVGLFATAQASSELIRQIGVDFLTNKQLFGISFLGEESFRSFIKKHGLKVLFGAVVPNPKTSDLEIVKEYRKEMDSNGYPYDIFSLEGYIATSILLDAIKHIEPPITKEKILQLLESYNDYELKGLTLTFNPERRDLANYIWLESGDDQEWAKKPIKKGISRDQNSDISRPAQITPKPRNPTP